MSNFSKDFLSKLSKLSKNAKIGILVFIVVITIALIFFLRKPKKNIQVIPPITPPSPPSTPKKIVLENMSLLPGVHLPGGGFLAGNKDDFINNDNYTYGQVVYEVEGGPSAFAMCSQLCESNPECKSFVFGKNIINENNVTTIDSTSGKCYLLKNSYIDKYEENINSPNVKDSNFDSGYKS